MSNKIKIIRFLGYRANLDTPDNNIEIKIEDMNTGEQKGYQTASVLEFRQIGEDLHLNVKTTKNPLAIKPMVYTASTLFLESNMAVKQKVKEFLTTSGVTEACVIKMFNGNIYIGENNTDFSVYSKQLDKNNEVTSDSKQKNELKVYETPTNIFQIYFSLFQKATLPERITNVAKIIRKEILQNEEVKNHFLFKNKDFKKEQILLIQFVLESYFSAKKKAEIESESENSNVRQMQNLIENHVQKYIKAIEDASDSLFPYKILDKITNDKPFRMSLFDLQAGSGTGIFKTAENANMSINLIGTEIRDISKDEKHNNDYNVITGTNTMLHLSDYTKLFDSIKMNRAVSNTVVYQNPPFTSTSSIAKESVNVLRHGQNIFGLYPTSMENFLKENVDGFIFNIPKELTGYTDIKVPERMLFVIGSKHDEEQVEMEIDSLKAKGLFNHNNIANTKPRNKMVVVSDTTIKDATQTIFLEIARSKGRLYNFKQNMTSVYLYNIARDGNSVLVDTLQKYIEDTNKKIDNIGKIKELIEKNKDVITKSLSPNQTLRKDKVFPDFRSYNPKREYKKLTYAELLIDRGLITFYRSKYPEIYNIVESLALEDGVDLDVKKPTHINYSLSNPVKPKEKDKISSESLGLMKLAYYPSSFSLYNESDKKAVMRLIEDIYKQEGTLMSDTIRDNLLYIIKQSSRIIIKTEDVISEELELKKDEVFVFVDEDGLDMAKLDISLTDFFGAMNRLKMFDINDYVEQAVLSSDKKEVIFNNFMKLMDNLQHLIVQGEKEKSSIFKREAIDLFIKLKTLKEDKSLTSDEFESEELSIYKEFAEKNKIYEYYAGFMVTTDSKVYLSDLIEKNVMFQSISVKNSKEMVDMISGIFEKTPISFYEDNRLDTENHIRQLFRKNTENSNLPANLIKEAEDNFIIDIFERLSSEYETRKTISEASIKTAKLFVVNKTLIDAYKAKGKSYNELYDLFYENIMMNTFGLMPHQFKTPERFVEMSNDKKADVQNIEPRGGKTLTCVSEMCFLMLYKGVDAQMILETKTVNDITSQILRFLPIMTSNIEFIMPKSAIKSMAIDKNKAYDFFTDSEIFVNIPKLMNPYFIKRGDGQTEELKRFGFEFEDLLSDVREKNINKGAIIEHFKESKFIHLLQAEC